MLTQGAMLGPYEVLTEIGSGGMGQVYRARDTRLGRDVAVKVLPAARPQDEALLRRFEAEARAAGSIDHPNILAIHDVGTENGIPYIVTELLEGQSLREFLGDGTPLPLRKVLDYAAQVARGLAEAHDKGIVHRDLKPENLFVTRDGRVKILDFGIAKLMGDGEASTTTPRGDTASHTRPGEILGTVGYMSPEQVRGQPADPRSDIFAFGCILYECLTGARAFEGETRVETAYAVLNDDPEPITSAGRRVPPALVRIVQRCLEKQAGERFQSARDLGFNLEKLSGLTSIVTGGQIVDPEHSLHVDRRVVRAIGFGALAIAVGAALFFAGRSFAPGKAEIVPPPPSPVANVPIPGWQQLTFRKGKVMSARFSPDGSTVVYSASHDPRTQSVFSTMTTAPESRPLGHENAYLASVSVRGELALLMISSDADSKEKGVLARVPLSGGSPRELLGDVAGADWGPDGESLAVVRFAGGSTRLEYPIGTVLAESRGWIGSIRVSPHGDAVAYLEHPLLNDDRGYVVVVDTKGARRELTTAFASANGLAWSPDGKEVWFTAADTGLSRALRAVSLDGRTRVLARIPGALTLHDVSPDGRVLATSDQDRMRIWAGGLTRDVKIAKIEKKRWDRDLSWFDWSLLLDLSSDGKAVLFNESGNGAGDVYSLYLRRTDGTPAVKLGVASIPATLSPDGSQVLAVTNSRDKLVLLPTGVGEPRSIDLAVKLDFLSSFAWLPDGKRALLHARAEGQLARIWLVDTVTRALAPLSAEDVSLGGPHAVAPDGTRAIVYSGGKVAIMKLPMGNKPEAEPSKPEPLPFLDAKVDMFVGWRADGRAIRVGTIRDQVPHLEEVALDTGRRTPMDTGDVLFAGGRLTGAFVTPDGRVGASSYVDPQSDLYLLDLAPVARPPSRAALLRSPLPVLGG